MKAVFALAENKEHAEKIVEALQNGGFESTAISFLLAHNHEDIALTKNGITEVTPSKGDLGCEKNSKAPEGGVTGATAGGLIGGSLGLLAGIGTLAIPGLGILIAAGPILAALSGTAVGGAIGLLIGVLVGLDLPEYEAKKYEKGIQTGNALISVVVKNGEQQENAKKILKSANAKDIATSREKAQQR